jgi:hypothetical protein
MTMLWLEQNSLKLTTKEFPTSKVSLSYHFLRSPFPWLHRNSTMPTPSTPKPCIQKDTSPPPLCDWLRFHGLDTLTMIWILKNWLRPLDAWLAGLISMPLQQMNPRARVSLPEEELDRLRIHGSVKRPPRRVKSAVPEPKKERLALDRQHHKGNWIHNHPSIASRNYLSSKRRNQSTTTLK